MKPPKLVGPCETVLHGERIAKATPAEAASAMMVVVKPVVPGENFAGAGKTRCFVCECEVWLDPRSPEGPAKVCWNCAPLFVELVEAMAKAL